MGRTLHEVFRIREVRDHRTGGTVVALNPPDTGSNRDPEIDVLRLVQPQRRSLHVRTAGSSNRLESSPLRAISLKKKGMPAGALVADGARPVRVRIAADRVG